MDENTDSSLNQSKKRTRGPTTCKKLKERTANMSMEKTIELGLYGKPTGKWKNEYTSYLGAIVRQKVDINIVSWKVVSEGLKNTIWEDIKGEWNIKDDEHKKRIMKRVGKMWKDFKSRMVDQLFEGNNPCEKYDYLKEEQWEKFKMTHKTEEFKEIREKAQKCQKKNKHVHYLGKGGYDAKRIKWLKDDPITHLSESIEPSLTSESSRGLDWVRARVKEKEGGEGYYFPIDSTKEVFEKMVTWKGKISEGSWIPRGHDDILTRALEKKEHGGYVRGIGGGACLRDVFGSEKGTQNSSVVSMDDLATITKRVRDECKEEMSEMHMKYNKDISEMHVKYSNEVNEMQTKFQGILDHFKQIGMPLPDNFGIELSTPKELIRSSCQSVDPNPPDLLMDIENPTPCRLCVIKSNFGKVVVARGMVFPSILPGASMVHGETIAPNNVKVCVDDVVGEFQTAPLPVPCNEHKMVGDAAGSFVEWPKNLVLLGQEHVLPEKTTVPCTLKKVLSQGSAMQPQGHDGSFEDDVKLQNLSEECKYLHDVMMLPTKALTNVDKDSEVFKHNLVKGQPIPVSREDISEFLRMSCLNIPILQIFMMYINKFCKESNLDDFGFMCPSALALVRKNPDLITKYMTNVMRDFDSKRFILAPYNQDNHWVLLLICCRESAVYMFSSLKRTSKIHLRGFLNVAYQVYVGPYGNKKGYMDTRIHWHENIMCPRQRGGTECGYYVMRYMYDIVLQYGKNSKTNWSKGICSEEPYTQQQIDEIRDIWAEYFTNECA